MNKYRILLILGVGLLFFIQSMRAQEAEQEYQPVIELKTAPLKAAAAGILNLGADFVINERFSVESIFDFGGGIIFDNRKIGTRVFGKFYVDPSMGADRLYMGSYLKYRYQERWFGIGEEESEFALGFLLGYKYVTKTGIVFEAGYGLGQTIASRAWNRNSSSPNAITRSERGILNLDAVAQISIGYRFGTINDAIEGDTGMLNRKPRQISNRKKTRR